MDNHALKTYHYSRQRWVATTAALCLFFSLLLLAYAYYRGSVASSINRARRLEAQRQFEQALQIYRQLEEELGRYPLLANHFHEAYSASLIGRLRMLYRQEQYDEVIELAERGVQEEVYDAAAVYFWSGNAYFLKGISQEHEDSFSFFNRAEADYRRALERDESDRWDIRYNYEFVKAVLEQAERDRGKQPLKLMRPREAETEQPATKVEG